jgi:hypothetical protein
MTPGGPRASSGLRPGSRLQPPWAACRGTTISRLLAHGRLRPRHGPPPAPGQQIRASADTRPVSSATPAESWKRDRPVSTRPSLHLAPNARISRSPRQRCNPTRKSDRRRRRRLGNDLRDRVVANSIVSGRTRQMDFSYRRGKRQRGMLPRSLGLLAPRRWLDDYTRAPTQQA